MVKMFGAFSILLLTIASITFALDGQPKDTTIDTATAKNSAIPSTPTGGRSQESILTVCMKYFPNLKKIYNDRLLQKKGLEGRIEVRFAIDEYGKVIFSAVNSSTVNDSVLEKSIAESVKSWQFETINKPGDVTEVFYPFVFTQQNNKSNKNQPDPPNPFAVREIIVSIVGIIVLITLLILKENATN